MAGEPTTNSDEPPSKRRRLADAETEKGKEEEPYPYAKELLDALAVCDVDRVEHLVGGDAESTTLSDEQLRAALTMVLRPSAACYAEKRDDLLKCVDMIMRRYSDADRIVTLAHELCRDGAAQLCDVISVVLRRVQWTPESISTLLLSSIMAANDRIVDVLLDAPSYRPNLSVMVNTNADHSIHLSPLYLALCINAAHYSRRIVPSLLRRRGVDPNRRFLASFNKWMSPMALVDTSYVNDGLTAEEMDRCANSMRVLCKHKEVDIHSMGGWQEVMVEGGHEGVIEEEEGDNAEIGEGDVEDSDEEWESDDGDDL